MTWGIQVWLDLWLVGIVGGTFSVAFLVDYFNGNKNGQLSRIAVYLGIPLVFAGVVLLTLDLGNPLRFWHMLTQFKVQSPMSMGTWLILAWLITGLATVLLWRFNKSDVYKQRLSVAVNWGMLVLSILLMVYSAVVPAVSGRTLWAGPVFVPVLFVASDVAMGFAVIIMAALIHKATATRLINSLKNILDRTVGIKEWGLPDRLIPGLGLASIIAIIIELVALGGHLGTVNPEVELGGTATTLVGGLLALPIWLGMMLLALLIPLVLFTVSRWGKLETMRSERVMAISSLFVVAGGFLLRSVILAVGQIV